jgi:hypothetical protein
VLVEVVYCNLHLGQNRCDVDIRISLSQSVLASIQGSAFSGSMYGQGIRPTIPRPQCRGVNW